MAWKLSVLVLEERSVSAGVCDMTLCDDEGSYEVMEGIVDDGYRDRDHWLRAHWHRLVARIPKTSVGANIDR